VFSDNAFMYLSPEAWSRSNSGRTFGMTLTPRQALTIRNADWDIASQHGMRGTMRLSFDAGLDAATTTLRRCALANAIANCSSSTVQPDPVRSPHHWDIRPVIDRNAADRLQLNVNTSGDGQVLSANLPWPSL